MTRRPRSTPMRPLIALTAAALALALWASPAAAHDGDAVITVEGIHPAGTSVHYIVRVTWADDGHPAADATVTATAVAADGTQHTPVRLVPADSDGRYAGVVEYPTPGNWTVRITSIEPTGAVEQAQDVAATAPTGAVEGDGEANSELDGSFAPADDDTGDETPADDDTGDDGERAAGGGSDDDGMPVYLVVAAAAVVLIGAATAVNIIRRNRPGTSAASTSGPSSPNGASSDGTVRDGGAPEPDRESTTGDTPPTTPQRGGPSSTDA